MAAGAQAGKAGHQQGPASGEECARAALLLAAERLLTGCHLSVDVVLGCCDAPGPSYWACARRPSLLGSEVGGRGLRASFRKAQGAPT